MKKVNIGLLVATAMLLMVGISALALSGALSGASSYVSFKEAKLTGEEVHVVGTWVKQDLAHYDGNMDMFEFYMQDTSQNVSLVRFFDPMPTNFKSADRIVVQGKYQKNEEVFVADRIFMKCPSKYNGDESSLEIAGAKE